MKTVFPTHFGDRTRWLFAGPRPISLLLLIFLVLFTWSCSGDSAGFSANKESAAQLYDEAAEAEYTEADGGQQSLAQQVSMERKIIKTSDFSIKVKKVAESTKRIEEMVAAEEGFISSMDLTNSTYRITSQVVIRVPAQRFDQLMDKVETESIYTNYRRVNAQDVTEEYLDIETRLKTKKQVRDRYVMILRDKAKTVEEVLQAEEAIRVIQEEIESREGRLNYLKNRVSMSTINLELYQEVPYTPDRGQRTTFWTRLKQSAVNGWALVVNIVLGLVTIWPLVLIGGVLLWRRKWIRRKLFGGGKGA